MDHKTGKIRYIQTDAAVGVDVGGGEIAEELGVRRSGRVAVVAGQVEALALGDGEGVGISIGAGFGGGAGLGVGVGEEQVIGDVFVAVAALLGQVVGPAKELKEGADELLLGGGLVDGVEGGGVFEEGVGLGAEGVEVCGLGEGFLPGGGVEDAFFEKVVGEQMTGHWQLLVGVGGVCGVVYPRGGCYASSGGYGRLDRGSAAARSVPVQGFTAAVVFGPLIHAWV